MSEWQPAYLIAVHGEPEEGQKVLNRKRVRIRPAIPRESFIESVRSQGCDADLLTEFFEVNAEDIYSHGARPQFERTFVCIHEILTD